MEEKRKEQTSKEKNILRAGKPASKPSKKNAEKPQTDFPLKEKASLEKESANTEEEKIEEAEENPQKPKKKKKIIKKTITKMVKKKVHKDSEEYLTYLREKERGFRNIAGPSSGGAFGNSAIISRPNFANISKPVSTHCECINCHTSIAKNSGKNLCDKCTNNLREANNNRELKSLKYYQDDADDKFDAIGTKEFYQLNKDRYMSNLWKEENEKIAKIDENFNKNKEEKNLENVEGEFLLEKPICSKCGKIQNQNLNKGIYFCKNCGGLICGNCSKAHYKENPEHNCNHVNIEDKNYWKVPEKIKCSNCSQLTPITEIYNCNICEGKPICKNCAQNHDINNPNHILKLFGKSDEENLEKTPIKLKKSKKEKEKDLLKCPNCGAKDIISNNNMIPCPTCNLTLCNKCQNDHYSKNPTHSKPNEYILTSDKKKLKSKLSDEKLLKKKSGDIPKCFECGKILGNDSDSIGKCNICQTNLCDDCGNKHQKNNKDHIIVQYVTQKSGKINIPYKRITIGTKCQECNNSLPLGEEECIIVNCNDCEGNLCDDCYENHEKNNPQHELNPIKLIFIENANDINDSIPKIKCKKCRKNISDADNIYYCDECQNDFCNNCGNNHNVDNPEHDLLLAKRIIIDDNDKDNITCRQCGKDLGNGDNSYKKCDKCKIDLCDACAENHIEKYPNHNIFYSLCRNNYNKNLNDYNSKELENQLKNPNDKCSNCNKRINLKNNDIISFCNNCNGNLCDNCNNIHNKNYPEHIKVNPKVIILDKDIDPNDYSKFPVYKCIACDKKLNVDLNNPYINCDKCHGNICDECNSTHLKEFPTHKLELKKYIIPDDNEEIKYLYKNLPISFECTSCFEKIPINPQTNYCNECKGNLCNNCTKLHGKTNRNHKPRILNSILIEKEKDNIFNIPKIKCNLCGTNLEKNINEYIHNCLKCKNILCDNCISKHNEKYPNHNPNINKYIFYDIKDESQQPDNDYDNKNKQNNLKSIQDEKCSICNKNIRPGNNKQIIHCNKCKGSLCDTCQVNHGSLFPGHDNIIKKYTIKKSSKKDDDDNLIDNDKCYNCKRNIPIINDGYIIYCLNCPGNICNSCGSNHVSKNPDHKIYNLNTLKLEKSKDEINNKCGDCGNNLNLRTVYNCNKCDKNLCDKCTNSHLKKKNSHNLVFIKYIEENYYPIECNVCGKKTKNENYRCDICKFNLCDPCSKTHSQKYPNHKLIFSPISFELDKNKGNKNISTSLFITNDKCNNCKQKINLKNNDMINYCKDCKGNLCNNCNNAHIKENPSHTISRPTVLLLKRKKDLIKLPIYKCIVCDKKLNPDINEPFINCDKCHGNLCDDCNNTHLQEFPGHELLLAKYIINNDNILNTDIYDDIPITFDCLLCTKKIPINSDNNYCHNCQGNICNKCIILHDKNNTNHKARKLNIILLEKENEKAFKIPKIKCNLCGAYLDKKINDYIQKCQKCNNILCDFCISKHNKNNPEHDLTLDKYIFYEILADNNNINNLKAKGPEKCFICNKNIKIGNNSQISHCNKCKGNLCDSCEKSHTSLFSGHDLILKKYIINMNPNINENINENVKNNEDIDLENINLIKNDKCLICYSDIPINDNDKIIYCHLCPGSLCLSCQREHNKKFPDHKTFELKSLINNNYNKGNEKNKCGECDNNLNLDIIFNCNKCNNNLCNKCGISHLKNSPEHEIIIIKNINEQNKNNILNKYQKDKCIICNKNLSLKNNDEINYCNNCKGIVCENCEGNHKNKNPEHINIKPNTFLLNTKKDNVNKLPIYKCIACDRNLKGDLNYPYINCDKCHGNICDECNITHLKEFPTHKLKRIKYIIDIKEKVKDKDNKISNEDEEEDINNDLEDKNAEKPRIKLRNKKIILKDDKEIDFNKKESKENLDKNDIQKEYLNKNEPHEIICISCNSKINNFKDCTPCYGFLCNSCNKSNQYENKFELINPEKDSSFSPSIVNCKICNEYLLKDINKPINHCIICNGNLCSNCSMNHSSKFPQHNLLLTKFILTQFISYDEKNLPKRNMCLECNKNLDSKLIHFCNQCQEKVCLECVEKHNNEYPEHILILTKNLGYKGSFSSDIGEKNKCNCYLCKSNHSESQSKKFYYCKECDKQICESCKSKHDEQNYSHIVINPHTYEDDRNKK